MLDSAIKELVEKGFTDANDANALGSRATDGKDTSYERNCLRLFLNKVYKKSKTHDDSNSF